MTLTCYCCGESYERGHFRCCAPPTGTPSHVWMGQHCKVCKPTPERTRCPRHCTCAARSPTTPPVKPLAPLMHDFLERLEAIKHFGEPRAETWAPYKENREPGEDG